MHSWGDEGSDKEDDWEYDDEESDEDIQEDEEDEEGRDRDEGDSEEEEDDDDCDEAEAGNWSTDGGASADAPKRTKGVEGRASDDELKNALRYIVAKRHMQSINIGATMAVKECNLDASAVQKVAPAGHPSTRSPPCPLCSRAR
jgi:hypothetical protein